MGALYVPETALPWPSPWHPSTQSSGKLTCPFLAFSAPPLSRHTLGDARLSACCQRPDLSFSGNVLPYCRKTGLRTFSWGFGPLEKSSSLGKDPRQTFNGILQVITAINTP